MAQHDFNIANQLFPATRADLNNAFVALASNSSGDAEPGTTYANQWWYETDTNTLKLRNEANSAWIEIATLDQSSNNVLSITTQGLTLGATAITASGTEINLLNDLTRGSIIYGNASGVTSELVKGSANTVLTSDGTDISWGAGPPTLTRGQIIYSNASGTTVALAPGTADQVLTSDGTDISWADAGGGSTTLNAVGTYALLRSVSSVVRSPGSTISGSSMYYANAYAANSGDGYLSSPQPSGTWRLMGQTGYYSGTATYTGTHAYMITVCVRIS